MRTISNGMDKLTLRKFSIIAVGAVIIIGLVIYFLNSLESSVVPADFTAARQRAASISQDIVNLTGETSRKISQADFIQNGGDVNRLLKLINDAKTTNTAAYQRAFDLSQTLQQMAQALNAVHPPRQQLGYEAIALELSLVSEFISYTGALNDFLNNLSKAVLDQSTASRKAAEDALATANQKAGLINTLNRDFLDKMAAFDQAG